MLDIPGLKKRLRDRGIKATLADLLALAPKNDPFGVFTKSRIAAAEWAAHVWHMMGEPQNVHIRRAHYWSVSSDVLKPDGALYRNVDRDWQWLCDATKYARYLNLIPVNALIDQRNPGHIVYANYAPDVCDIGVPSLRYNPGVSIDLFGIHRSVSEYAEEMAAAAISRLSTTIEYNEQNAQPFHLEIWGEKSTMNDVLLPVCKRCHANLVTALGQVSLTQCANLVRRACTADKPARIFYISDHDPAGASMPKAAARKIEWCVTEVARDVDVQLCHIALTHDQCTEYQLPRTPIKDSDRAKGNFEQRYGSGATELDALEALHPGELARIVTDALGAFYDHRIGDELQTFRWRLCDEIHDQVRDSIIDQANSEVDGLFAEIMVDAEDIQQKIKPDVDILQEKVEKLDGLLSHIKLNLDVNTEPPRSGLVVDDSGWLFDSKRNYREQMRYYKKNFQQGD